MLFETKIWNRNTILKWSMFNLVYFFQVLEILWFSFTFNPYYLKICQLT